MCLPGEEEVVSLQEVPLFNHRFRATFKTQKILVLFNSRAENLLLRSLKERFSQISSSTNQVYTFSYDWQGGGMERGKDGNNCKLGNENMWGWRMK